MKVLNDLNKMVDFIPFNIVLTNIINEKYQGVS